MSGSISKNVQKVLFYMYTNFGAFIIKCIIACGMLLHYLAWHLKALPMILSHNRSGKLLKEVSQRRYIIGSIYILCIFCSDESNTESDFELDDGSSDL